MSQLLVVTDLDGSLLNHDDYSFAAAGDALAKIRARAIPLILASSKTRAEMRILQRELAIDYPFICENGAAICTPGELPDREVMGVEVLAPPREQVLESLRQIREAHGFQFTGFADSSVEAIAAMTGLSVDQAGLAARREFSEPLRWEDSEANLEAFRDALAALGLVALQGGRFLSVAGPCDKAQALQRLRHRYGGAEGTRVIALGDSPNDESMLAAADIAVIIKSARSDDLRPVGPDRVIRTLKPGSAGWQEAMGDLLAEKGQDG